MAEKEPTLKQVFEDIKTKLPPQPAPFPYRDGEEHPFLKAHREGHLLHLATIAEDDDLFVIARVGRRRVQKVVILKVGSGTAADVLQKIIPEVGSVE